MYVYGGVTTYSDEAKVKLLDVNIELLERYGAVSEEVAIAMALGVQKRLGVEFGLSATGIAGPAGAVSGKPVGTVHVALVGPDSDIISRRCQLPGDRRRVKFQASQVALNLLRKKLLSS